MELRQLATRVREGLANILDPQRSVRRQRSEGELLAGIMTENIADGFSLAPGQWGRMFSPNSGIPTGFVRKCHCGESKPFPDFLIFEHLEEKDYFHCGNRSCTAKHGPYDFPGDVRLRVDSVSESDPAMKAIEARFEGAITAKDYTQAADGKYWLNPAKYATLFAALPQVPDTTITREHGGWPCILPTAGPDPVLEWVGSKIGIGTEADPFAGGPGFQAPAQRSAAEAQLPKSWLEKRKAVYERFEKRPRE